jgi:hypothetical protein
MNLKKIMVWITFIFFIIDRNLDGDKTNYNSWIIIFLFWIAMNTVKDETN